MWTGDIAWYNAYGKETIRFNENSIVVTLPYQRLGAEVYGKESTEGIPSVIPQVKGEIPPVDGIIPQVIPQVDDINMQTGIPDAEGRLDRRENKPRTGARGIIAFGMAESAGAQ